MRFDEFRKLNEQMWDEYFSEVFKKILRREIVPQKNGALLFPNIILFTQTKHHYIVELLGTNRGYRGLTTKIHKEKSTLKYMYQFEWEEDTNYKDALFHLSSEGSNNRGGGGFKGILFSRPRDSEKLSNRFNFLNHWKGPEFIRIGDGDGPLVTLDNKKFTSHFWDDCVLVNRLKDVYRVKHIVHMSITDKNYPKDFYVNDLRENFQSYKNPFCSEADLYGIKYCEEEKLENLALSNQFVNAFLIPGLRETTIGEFLKKNPSFITKALSCQSFLYEHDFEWIEGNPDAEEKVINPDLMLKRTDGFYDICELKTPKTHEKNLAKGKHKRRTFVSYVDEGLSQLANYEEYFEFEKNKEMAKNKHNVEVQEPILYLIVGNYENLTPNEIREASRKLKSNYRVIDYDTLNALFLSKVLEG